MYVYTDVMILGIYYPGWRSPVLSFPTYPEVEKAKKWLEKCHPKLCNGKVPPVLNVPGISFIGDEGNSLIPGLILIDLPSQNGDVGHIIDTLAHECMHKRNGRIDAFVDYYFKSEVKHLKM